MLKTMYLKELLDFVRSLRFTLGWISLLILMVTAVFLLSSEVADRTENQQNLAKDREEYVSNYAHLNRINYFVQPTRQIEKLEVLYRGLDNEAENRSFFSDPLGKLFAKLDLLYISTLLLSLLALIFTYDAVCGEKENGTLKLIHTTPVSRIIVIVSKWLGAMTAIFVPFIVVLLFSLLLAATLGSFAIDSETVLDVATITFATVLYVGFFVALGLFISAMTRNSGTSILVLLFLWVMIVLAIPNVSPLIASQISPLPSVNAVEREIQYQGNTVRDNRISEAFEDYWQQLRNKYQLPEDRSIMRSRERLITLGWNEEKIDEVLKEYNDGFEQVADRINAEQGALMNSIIAELMRKVDRQSNLAKYISLLSPTASFNYFSTDIASVGLRAEEYVSDEIGEYYRGLGQFLEVRQKEQEEKLGHSIGSNDFIDLSGWPRYQHRTEAFADRFSGVALYLGHLVLFVLAALVLASVVYVRYDIR